MFDFRAWLRRAPKPRKLRLTNADGDDRIVDLGGGRCKWAEVENTVKNANAALVECLDASGEILRSHRFEEEEIAASPEDERDKLVAKTQGTNAAMLDAYGKRLVEAFHAGAASAAVSQENLVAIVETLTAHLSLSISNMHTLSVNMANLVSQQEPPSEGSKSDAMMGLLTAMIAGKQQLAAPPPPNGGKKP